jgi:hypothetical protein
LRVDFKSATVAFNSAIWSLWIGYLAMFLKELIKQHRIHRFVADREWFALLVPRHQVGIYLCHLFCHEAELRDAIRVKLVLVALSIGWTLSLSRSEETTVPRRP